MELARFFHWRAQRGRRKRQSDHDANEPMKPKQEAELLMNDLLPRARQMLRQHGEFSPYGGLLRADGSIVHVGAADSAREHPRSADLIESLRQQLRDRVKLREIKAAAIVFDVRVTPPGVGHASDAIEVLVQHRDSYCAEVFFPYRLKDGQPMFGQVFAQSCGAQIFE